MKLLSGNRVLAIAKITFKEAIRMRLFLAMSILALASFLSSFFFQDFNFGSSELKFIADFGFGGMTLFGALLAIVATVQLMMGDIEQRVALTILAKPTRRSEFVLGKFLGAWATILCFIAMLTACLLGALWLRETTLMAADPEAFQNGRMVLYGQIALYGAMQGLKLGIICALAVLFSSYASSGIFAVSMGILVWVAGQLRHLADGALESSTSLLGKAIYGVAGALVPRFQLFEFGDRLALGEAIGGPFLLKLATYALLYGALYLAVACAAFNRREL